MKAKFVIPLALATGLTLAAGSASASDPVFGALVGGATGAVIGHAIGGHDAAVAGGAFGAIVGAAAASQHEDRYYDDGYYGQRQVYGAPVYVSPPVVYEHRYYGQPPVVVNYGSGYGYHDGWNHHDRGDHDRWHHDGHRDHRGW